MATRSWPCFFYEKLYPSSPHKKSAKHTQKGSCQRIGGNHSRQQQTGSEAARQYRCIIDILEAKPLFDQNHSGMPERQCQQNDKESSGADNGFFIFIMLVFLSKTITTRFFSRSPLRFINDVAGVKTAEREKRLTFF